MSLSLPLALDYVWNHRLLAVVDQSTPGALDAESGLSRSLNTLILALLGQLLSS